MSGTQRRARAAPTVSRITLPVLLASVVVVTIDISMTSTALPAIAQGLGVAPATTIWIVNIYYLAVVAALLPTAAMGEIFGHERVFTIGLAIFAAGALIAGLAESLETLIAGRAVLGIGSAATSATTPALIRALYPPDKMGRGLGLYAMIVGVSITAGPTATSAILSVADWPWLFLQAAVSACVATLVCWRTLPQTERSPRAFDGVAAGLCAAMFSCLLFAIAGAAHLGAGPALAALGAAAVLAVALRRREANEPTPLLAADLFRAPLFALSSATAIVAFSVQGLSFVAMPFLLHYELGFSQVQTGLLIIPWPASLVVMSIVAPRLSERIAPGILGGFGLVVLALGLALLATIPPEAGPVEIGWRLVICGVGFGFFQSPNMLAIMSSAPRERSGGAGGILATSRLLGQSVGAAGVALCISVSPERGVHVALWLGVAAALLGSCVSLARLAPAVRRAGRPPG
ncbi:MFS transporter [uncultured Albimonas sp.]|uniref:MFS transporter n=1 Tax=uncultured Albimonas sp. TaxID=1331701 RepID=UPI0030EE769A|tara:strand:- start:230 stop:1612 length:1383 start_codon:yes stop_codon:yes gene_type:complete